MGTHHFRLEAPTPASVRHYLTGLSVTLGEGRRTSRVTITRTGQFTDPRYGAFAITREMLLAMVENFRSRTYGQDIFVDVAHKPEGGAAAKIVGLSVEGNRLRAEVEWTPYGVEAVQSKGYQYLSAEFAADWVDNESGRSHGPLLLGAGLTIRPVIKRLDPVQLAESSTGEAPTYLHPELARTLTEEASEKMKDWIKKLQGILAQYKLSEAVAKQLLAAFEGSIKHLGEDAEAVESVLASYEATAKQLAEAIGERPAEVNITVPAAQGKTLSEADVKRILSEQHAEEEKSRKATAERLAGHRKLFAEVIEAAEGLDEDTRKAIGEGADLLTADMDDGQVRRLAEFQVEQANRAAARNSLAGMGFAVAGSPRIEAREQGALRLQEQIHSALRGSMAYGNGSLRLHEDKKLHPFARRVLAEFDRIHAHRLAHEAKVLAGGTTGIGDTSLPIGYQREVIRESLSDLNVLNLVQTLTDPAAQATTQVPYETRDVSAVLNDGIVYERTAIHKASITQAMDTAYILAMKLALDLSNEVIHFSRAATINWDAWGRNIASNARYLRELVSRRIANHMQRVSDAFGATAVANEDLDAQLTGSASTVKTAQFPIVRPHQQYDLQGNTVGAASNPITVRLNGTAISEYDGTGTQAAGTYYRVTSYNLGYVQFVDEAGAAVTPSATGNADDISYSYATNVAKFDLDVPSGDTLEHHLNGLLRSIGARKAAMSADRYEMPNFVLTSPVLMDTVTNAEQFAVSLKRDGTDTTMEGDLGSVKGMGAWATNAPSIDLGDERILIGVRGTTSYVVAKPFVTGMPFEGVNGDGNPIGTKVAYGEEYSAVHTPSPITNRFTSVLAYSATGR